MKKKMSLKELDFNNAGSWPREWQLGFCFALGMLILFLMWNFLTRPKMSVLEGLEADETTKRQEFEKLQGQAANLEPLKQQLAQMEIILQQMLRQLPSKNEMPDLIVDVSQQALASGITNELFQPGAEEPREFYAEKPIAIRMVGDYHQFGAFMSGVASLPRVVIMTMHDISLKPRGVNNELLEMAGTIKTYRYLDPDEQQGSAVVEGGAP